MADSVVLLAGLTVVGGVADATSAGECDVCVANGGSRSVSVIDTVTQTVADLVTVGSDPNAVAIGCVAADPIIDVTASGRTVQVVGSGFPSDSPASLTIGSVQIASATAGSDGGFTITFEVTDCTISSGGKIVATSDTATAIAEATLTPCAPRPVAPVFAG